MASIKKTSKSRSDTAVQGTNDSSIISKCSAARKGYFEDDFLQYLVAKEARRSPLINRGYYIRAMVMKHCVSTFLKQHGQHPNQIISLGAGFDSGYFRLKSKGLLVNTSYIEVDFPDVMQRKWRLIDYHEALKTCLTDGTGGSDDVIFNSKDFKMLGVDLTHLTKLTQLLTSVGVDFDQPTMLVSEVVLTYMAPKFADEIIRWASKMFANAVFIQYEQVHPADAFGIVMKNHFCKIGSPLKCIDKYPTPADQEQRFQNMGWPHCAATDLNFFYYNIIGFEEHERMQLLEPFDEFEEWHLKCSHYTFVSAVKGSCTAVMADMCNVKKSVKEMSDTEMSIHMRDIGLDSNLLPDMHSKPENTAEQNCTAKLETPAIGLDLFDVKNEFKAYGHSATLLPGNQVFITGGFGEVSGKHSRLKNFVLYDLKSRTFTSHSVACNVPLKDPTERLFHTASALNVGRIVLFGGRLSPTKPCDMLCVVQVRHPSSLPETSVGSPSQSITSDTDMEKELSNKCAVGEKYPENPQKCALRTGSLKSDELCNQVAEDLCTTSSLMDITCDSCQKPIEKKSQSNELGNMSHQNVHEREVKPANCDHAKVCCQQIAGCGSGPCPRWRHGAVTIKMSGVECLLVYGGCSPDQILDDCYILDIDSWKWTKITTLGDSPMGRHSHSMAVHGQHVLLSGGLNKNYKPTGTLYALNTLSWEWTKVNTIGNLLPRYSHTSCMLRQSLVLVGGVNLEAPPPGVALIDMDSLKCQEYRIPATVNNDVVMLHGHASVALTESSILILGGGGNCFSFGTHLNSHPLLLQLGEVLDLQSRGTSSESEVCSGKTGNH